MTSPTDPAARVERYATPEQIAAAWKAFRGDRPGTLLGPGPAFAEAIEAALRVGANRLSKTAIALADEERVAAVEGEAIERAARALCRLHIARNRRWDTPTITEDKIQAGVEYAWRDYQEEAIVALAGAGRAVTDDHVAGAGEMLAAPDPVP